LPIKKPHKPNLYVIAGPNGAGKTTFAREFLPHFVGCLEFVNADFIAAGVSVRHNHVDLMERFAREDIAWAMKEAQAANGNP